MEIKTIINKIDDNFLDETIDDSIKYTDEDKIGRYENKDNGSYFDLFYHKEKDITIQEIYDGYYSYTFTYKTKIDPNHMVLYYAYKQLDE